MLETLSQFWMELHWFWRGMALSLWMLGGIFAFAWLMVWERGQYHRFVRREPLRLVKSNPEVFCSWGAHYTAAVFVDEDGKGTVCRHCLVMRKRPFEDFIKGGGA